MEVTRRQFLKAGAVERRNARSLGPRLRRRPGQAGQAAPAHRGGHRLPLRLPVLRRRVRAPRVHQEGRRTARSSCCRSRATRTARSTRGASARRARAHCSSPSPAGVSPARCTGSRGRASGRTVSWDFALDKLAQQIKASRDRTFVTMDADGNVVNRCEGIAFAGGAAFSSEEGYFATKLMRGHRHRLPRATGPCLTRSHGDQFGRHVWPRGHDQPLA